MSQAQIVRFPRGFFFSRDPAHTKPQHYLTTGYPGLSIAPDSLLQEASEGGDIAAVVGLCVLSHRTRPEYGTAAAEILRSARRADESLMELLDNLCGKYVVFLRCNGVERVFHDAAATRSVFYRRDFRAIASHASLIAVEPKSLLPFKGDFPGHATPYPDVKILAANNALDFTSERTYRYWPRGPLSAMSVEAAAHELTNLATKALKNLPANSDIRLALTAGLDSRTSLALLLKSRRQFSTYTYYTGATADLVVPALLFKVTRKNHTLVATPPAGDELKDAISEVSFFGSTAYAIPGVRRHFSSVNPVSIISNIFEIGQGYYQKIPSATAPVDARTMQQLYASRQFGQASEIMAYSSERYKAELLDHFEEMYQETSFEAASKWLDPHDLFYWEHRMTSWHSTQMLERDFYAEGFIALNSRAAISTMLAVDLQDRIDCSVFRRVMQDVDSRLLDFPFNPVSLADIGQ